MHRLSRLAFSAVATLSLIAGGNIAAAPIASANPGAGNITIYPNFGDWKCGSPGQIQSIQVAAIPGNSVNWTKGRWAALQVPKGARIKIVANVYCAQWSKNGAGYHTIQGTIGKAEANKSYWF